jgi:hypothetical protein
MGCMCRDGIGCPIDVDRARGYFQLAADQGHSKANISLDHLARDSHSAPVTPRSHISTSDGGPMRSTFLETPSFRELFRSEELVQSVQSIHKRYQHRIAEATEQFQQEIRDLEQRFAHTAGLAPSVLDAPSDGIFSNTDSRVLDLTQAPGRPQDGKAVRSGVGRKFRPN